MSDKNAKKIIGMLDGFLGGDSSNDPRFKFSVGERVKVNLEPYQYERYPEWKVGYIGEILARRNAYPPPSFEGCWVPIYYVKGLGEIGEGCLERTTK